MRYSVATNSKSLIPGKEIGVDLIEDEGSYGEAYCQAEHEGQD